MTYRKPAHRPLLASVKEALTDIRLRRPLGQLAAAGVGAIAPFAVLASPTGGQVVGGQASISNPGANATLVKQTSQNAVINWQQFSVGANQYVQFLQPDSSAVVLNRVIGGNPSSILGNISANGQVFLINPNGILFGRGAVLDVSGLVASTQDISTADFMAGRYNFTKAAGAPDASVINQGTLSANGGYVVLAGDYVENDGVINAQSGRVLLAAGGGTTLTLDKNQGLIGYSIDSATLARLAGANNTGSITADGGTVIMTADVANALTATAVNNSGFVAAHSITSRGGVIVLAAQGGDIDNSGTLDASATDAGVAGGTVILRGNGHTQLEPTSVINTEGDGAKGGFVELSGHTLHVGGQVGVGRSGNLLIDPPKLFITSGNTAAGVITSGGYVGEHFIDTQLNAGVNVTLVASGSILAGVPVGVPSVGPATNITATGAGNLTMRTGTLTAGTGGSLANIGTGGNCAGAGVCQPGATVRFTATSGNVNLSGVTINVKGGVNIQASHGSVKVGAITANGIFIGGGKITISGNLAAPSASMGLSANPGSPAGGFIKAVGKTLSGKRVDLVVSATSYGGLISIGSINATSHAGISADVASGVNPDTIKTGAITAPNILIHAAGLHENITTGPLTAVNTGGVVSITLDEKVFPGAGGSGNITVNGNIIETGKTALTYGSLKQVGLPIAAGLFINDSGSAGTTARSVKINGNISLTGNRGSYHAGSCECGVPNFPHHLQHGSGGAAAAFINVTGSHGAASVTGSINAKAPDAFVLIQGHSVTVNNIMVTGSGHHVSRSLGPHSAGISYASSNSAGQATLGLGDVSGTTSYGGTTLVKTGNITVSGKGVAEAGLFGTQ
ncbi:MAG TPA: filamentous hemagglutinin N-terminal domain-containing protein, partial [Gammaproteobacteria bacterium]|nr:filamentous hemagglutinin N-terminal domain-containing protein [Gammaproteobacteria bacterium]